MKLAPLLVLLSSAALAGTAVTTKDGDYVLHNPDNSIPAPFDKTTGRFPTPDACKSAAGTIKPGQYKCDTSIAVTVTATCDDVPKPSIPRVKDADGFTMQPPLRYKEGSEGELTDVEIQDYVAAPAPACWVMGWRDATVADLSPPTADAELPNTIEPMATPAGFDEERRTPVQEAKRHDLHLCDEDDLTPCPPLAPVPTACGQQFCGVIG